MTPTDAPPALHAGHFAQIAAAGRALRTARKADRVAGFSGLAIMLGGIAFLPFTLGSGFGIALVIALVVIGWRERTLRADVRAVDPLGFGRLARNQIALAFVLSAYGVSRLLAPVPAIDGLDTPGLRQLGGDLDSTVQRVAAMSHYGVGAGIILLAWLVQGGQAAYYARAGRSVRRAHARFPVWVMRVHAAAWGGRTPPVSPHPGPAETSDPGAARGAPAAQTHPDLGDVAA